MLRILLVSTLLSRRHAFMISYSMYPMAVRRRRTFTHAQAEQATASTDAAAATKKDLLASVEHLEALDEAAVLRLTCVGKKRVSDDGSE